MTFTYEYAEKPKFVPSIFSDGEARFTIEDTRWLNEDGSKKTTLQGVPKITFKLAVEDCKGKKGFMFHDISAKMQWAFIQLGEAIGKKVYNESATMDWHSLIGCSGVLVIENQASQPNKDPSKPDYPARSVVKKYLPKCDAPITSAFVKPQTQIRSYEEAFDDDSIPF